MTVTNAIKIVLVDDDIFYKEIFQQLMHSLGYKDVWYYVSADNMMNEENEEADVVFIDYGMDVINGISLLKQIKLKNPHQYVVFISANEGAGIINESTRHGAFEYVVKGRNEAEQIKKILARIQQIQNLLYNNRHKSTNR